MKMIYQLRICISVCILTWASRVVCDAQTLYDRSNMTLGRIDSDGRVYNNINMNVGRFKSDGYIVNRNNMNVGKISYDGIIVDSSNMTIGKVDSDGQVKDRNNMTISYAKGVSKTYAAVFFFFDLFQR